MGRRTFLIDLIVDSVCAADLCFWLQPNRIPGQIFQLFLIFSPFIFSFQRSKSRVRVSNQEARVARNPGMTGSTFVFVQFSQLNTTFARACGFLILGPTRSSPSSAALWPFASAFSSISANIVWIAQNLCVSHFHSTLCTVTAALQQTPTSGNCLITADLKDVKSFWLYELFVLNCSLSKDKRRTIVRTWGQTPWGHH